MKVTDFNGCWCEATEEIYSYFNFDWGYKQRENVVYNLDKFGNFYSWESFKANKHRKEKQIHLVNGQWEYVNNEVTRAVNFLANKCEEKDYIEIGGYKFEKPEFECELLKVFNARKEIEIIGYVIGKNNSSYPCVWTINGRIWKTSLNKGCREEYNLTPLKEWYEDESNFPCICTADNGKTFYIANNKSEASHIYNPSNDDIDRLATKEEVLSLLVE